MSKIVINDKGVIAEEPGNDEVIIDVPVLIINTSTLNNISSSYITTDAVRVAKGKEFLTNGASSLAGLHTPLVTANDPTTLLHRVGETTWGPGGPSYPKALLAFGIHTGSLSNDTYGATLQSYASIEPTLSSSSRIAALLGFAIVTGSGPGVTSTGRVVAVQGYAYHNSPRTVSTLRGGAFLTGLYGNTNTAETYITASISLISQVVASATGTISNAIGIFQPAVGNSGNAKIHKIYGIACDEPADGIGDNCTNLIISKNLSTTVLQTSNNIANSGFWSIFNASTRPNFQASKTCFDSTDASATPGSVTINKPAGIVAIAAGNAGVTVTNSYVTASSIIVPTLRTADATLTSIKCVLVGSGSFTISGSANATAATSVSFIVYN